jgi:hypothetical protein
LKTVLNGNRVSTAAAVELIKTIRARIFQLRILQTVAAGVPPAIASKTRPFEKRVDLNVLSMSV